MVVSFLLSPWQPLPQPLLATWRWSHTEYRFIAGYIGHEFRSHNLKLVWTGEVQGRISLGDCFHKARRMSKLWNYWDFPMALNTNTGYIPPQTNLLLQLCTSCQCVILWQSWLGLATFNQGLWQFAGGQEAPAVATAHTDCLHTIWSTRKQTSMGSSDTVCTLLGDMLLHACVCFTKSV